MPKSKLSTALYLLLVFLSGALVGGFAYRAYSLNTVIAASVRKRPDPEEWRRHYVEAMRTRVHLDDQQVAKLQQILDNTKNRFDEMHTRVRAEGQGIQNDQVDSINAILRDDQKPLYEQFRTERDKKRKQSDKK
ncbi:MAG TPA: hypothetical protein VG675_11955 [Bryobacteraceae bacterium]|nr:hypothetical protein [Bryobacteraceae bacterium]